MICHKKSYAMKMLQLALALSLLQVDPDNYLYQRLGSWDSQLELRDGDGWELEMLRAVPMVEYPYANRKTMLPLIEDLVRFDRQHANNQQYNVTAYLLNVHGDTANQTAAVQELQPTAAVTTSASAASSVPPVSDAAAAVTVLEHAASIVNSSGVADIDIFLNSESFQDQLSIWEQNLADLNDFGELAPSINTYAGLPMKEEPLEAAYFDFRITSVVGEEEEEGEVEATGTNDDSRLSASDLEPDGAVALNDSTPNPSDTTAIKVEQSPKDDNIAENATMCSLLRKNCVTIKEEEVDQEEAESEILTAVNLRDVELTKEESEIVEVLWKQDVDLGYTLTSSPDLIDRSLNANIAANNTKFQPNTENISADDVERLKALEELKLDKLNFDSKDEPSNYDDDLSNSWAGIRFTIDNETGEYIRLPLDDLLNDVLQLADFVEEREEEESNNNINNNDSIASTSKAAAFKINNNNRNPIKTKTEVSIDDDDDDDDSGEENADNKGSSITANNNKNENNHNKHISKSDDLPQSKIAAIGSLASPPLFGFDEDAKEELDDLNIMIQSAASPFHHHPHLHPHHPHHSSHYNAHHRPAAGSGMQNYAVGGGVNSAFHRQASGYHHSHHHLHHHHHQQGRVPLSRGVSMEQRLQDIASLFNPIPGSMGVGVGMSDMTPYSHYPSHHYAYQSAAAPAQHAQYPHPPPPPPPHHAMLHANANALGMDICSSTQPHYGHNLGSAVSSSMHLTNASHDGSDAGANLGAYKMEHDMMYYSNASSDMNHTTDGFINSILNDEDLHLMDMNVNENFCRMVDANNNTSNNSSGLGGISSIGVGGAASGIGGGAPTNPTLSMSAGGSSAGYVASAGITTAEMMNAGATAGNDRLDASSDSAVSSMGSERVPSLSDGEWGEGSDSAQDYHHHSKYGGGPYDYSYNNNNGGNAGSGSRQPSVAQKKHQMFGKRYLQEPPPSAPPSTLGATGLLQSSSVVPPPSLPPPPPHIKYEYEPSYAAALSSGGGVGGVPQSNQHMNATEGLMPPATGLGKQMQAYAGDFKYANGGGCGGSGTYSLDFTLRPPRTPHDFVQHNHTYTLPHGSGGVTGGSGVLGCFQRAPLRDKKLSSSSSSSSSSYSFPSATKRSTNKATALNGDEEQHQQQLHLTRDEKRARALNIPIPVNDIINLPMDEFNERLSKYELNENQLSLIRDIRRRGKNKVAAQNCRKRKLDQILSLEDEVKEVRHRKDQLCSERDSLACERKRIVSKFGALHRHIFQYLRDAEGNACSPAEYSLQQAADGSIYLLPRDINKTDAGSVGSVTATATPANTSTHLHGAQSQTQSRSHTHPHAQHMTHASTLQQHQQQQQTHHNHAQQHAASALTQQQQQQQTHAHHTHANARHATQTHASQHSQSPKD